MHKDSPLILDSYTRTEIQDYVKRQQKMREWRHFMAANHIVVVAEPHGQFLTQGEVMDWDGYRASCRKERSKDYEQRYILGYTQSDLQLDAFMTMYAAKYAWNMMFCHPNFEGQSYKNRLSKAVNPLDELFWTLPDDVLLKIRDFTLNEPPYSSTGLIQSRFYRNVVEIHSDTSLAHKGRVGTSLATSFFFHERIPLDPREMGIVRDVRLVSRALSPFNPGAPIPLFPPALRVQPLLLVVRGARPARQPRPRRPPAAAARV